MLHEVAHAPIQKPAVDVYLQHFRFQKGFCRAQTPCDALRHALTYMCLMPAPEMTSCDMVASLSKDRSLLGTEGINRDDTSAYYYCF